MPEDLSSLVHESGLPPEELGDVVTLLEELRAVSLPPASPSRELAALLGGGAPAPAPGGFAVPPPRRRTGIMLGALLLGVSGGGVAAAAANVLPDPLQSVVADFSERFLPFEFPAPGGPGQERGPETPVTPSPGEQQTLVPRDGGVSGGPVTPGSPDGTSGTPGADEPPAPEGTRGGTPAPAPDDAPAAPPSSAPSPSSDQAPTRGPEEPPADGAPEPRPPAPEEDLAEQWLPTYPEEQLRRDGAAAETGAALHDLAEEPAVAR